MKTKPKFPKDAAVITATSRGIVKEIAPFADHYECLVKFADGTASWIHEDNLRPETRDTKPETL